MYARYMHTASEIYLPRHNTASHIHSDRWHKVIKTSRPSSHLDHLAQPSTWPAFPAALTALSSPCPATPSLASLPLCARRPPPSAPARASIAPDRRVLRLSCP